MMSLDETFFDNLHYLEEYGMVEDVIMIESCVDAKGMLHSKRHPEGTWDAQHDGTLGQHDFKLFEGKLCLQCCTEFRSGPGESIEEILRDFSGVISIAEDLETLEALPEELTLENFREYFLRWNFIPTAETYAGGPSRKLPSPFHTPIIAKLKEVKKDDPRWVQFFEGEGRTELLQFCAGLSLRCSTTNEDIVGYDPEFLPALERARTKLASHPGWALLSKETEAWVTSTMTFVFHAAKLMCPPLDGRPNLLRVPLIIAEALRTERGYRVCATGKKLTDAEFEAVVTLYDPDSADGPFQTLERTLLAVREL